MIAITNTTSLAFISPSLADVRYRERKSTGKRMPMYISIPLSPCEQTNKVQRHRWTFARLFAMFQAQSFDFVRLHTLLAANFGPKAGAKALFVCSQFLEVAATEMLEAKVPRKTLEVASQKLA